MDAQSSDALILRSLLVLKPHTRIQDLRMGDVIFSSGDSGDCLYGVLEGRVGLSWAGCSRCELLGPGRCFGEEALVQPGHSRHGTAIAMEPTKLIVLDREMFLFALEALPMFAVELLASLESRLRDVQGLAAR